MLYKTSKIKMMIDNILQKKTNVEARLRKEWNANVAEYNKGLLESKERMAKYKAEPFYKRFFLYFQGDGTLWKEDQVRLSLYCSLNAKQDKIRPFYDSLKDEIKRLHGYEFLINSAIADQRKEVELSNQDYIFLGKLYQDTLKDT